MRSAEPAAPWYVRPRALVTLVLVLTLVRLAAGGLAWLSEDEAYYRLWGLDPAWGYYDHPPMIGWWIAAGQWLAGDTALGVRLLGILATALGSLALWRTADLLYGRAAAGWSVLFFNATILIGVGSLIATPDAPSVLFWGLTLWALAEWRASENANWWLAVGLFAGLGLISKYSVLFLGAGILLWLVVTPRLRGAFATWQLWAGGALAALVTAPVIWWNAAHHWASFAKQFGRAVPHGWTTRYVGEFLGAELGLLNPAIAVFALIGIGLAVAALVRRDEGRARAAGLLLLTSLPFFAYLLLHSFHARVQANWPAPLFPALVLLAAGAAAQTRNGMLKALRAIAVPLGLAISLVVYVHAVVPLTGSFARKDPTFQLRGWPAVAADIARLAQENDAAWVATTAYGMTGQLAFALDLPVVQLDQRIRYVMAPAPDPALLARPALYVAVARRDAADGLRGRFAEVTPLAVLRREVRGTLLEEIRVYRVAGAAAALDPVFPAVAN